MVIRLSLAQLGRAPGPSPPKVRDTARGRCEHRCLSVRAASDLTGAGALGAGPRRAEAQALELSTGRLHALGV